MNIAIKGLLPEERKYTATQSQQIMGQTGCIGHLRAQTDEYGAFPFSWEDHFGDEKTQAFKEELDTVINGLRFDTAIFKDRKALSRFCQGHPEFGFGNGQEWGIRVDTEKYAYLMQLDPRKGVYNLYCYCYRRDWLDHHIQQARRGIRFITPDYEEKFRIPDGDQVRITAADGKTTDRTVRFIDEYHMEVGAGFSSNLYHICEFAEIMERNGATVIPLRSSLPEKCFVYVESTDEIGVVKRGEMGYWPADVTPDKGVSKRDTAEHLNDAQGVTKAQAAAMKAGSLCGWDTKVADPANYSDEGIPLKKSRDRGEAR